MNIDQSQTIKASILVVDDSRTNLHFLTGILAKHGYTISQASDGSHALLAARTELPDVILLDIAMPDMSGYEVCEQLKADKRTSDIPVIFISGLDDVFDKVKAFSVGGVDYITKPIQTEELLARVATHLAMRKMQQQLQQQNIRLQQEIAERKHAEEELRTLQRYAEDIISSSLDMIIAVDIDRHIIVFNEAAQETFGYTLEEVQGKHINLLYADKEEGTTVYYRTLHKGRCLMEISNKRKNGEVFPCLLSASILYDTHGKPIGSMGISRDISKIKQKEEHLRQLKKAIEIMQLGVTITDLDGKIFFTNRAEAKMHGYQTRELLGQEFNIFVPAEHRKPLTLDQIKEWKDLVRESIHLRKNGTTFPVRLMSEIVKGSDGEPQAIVTSCEDITARKQAEEELHRLNQKLKEANASKDKLFSIIAHDLRTPFSAVLAVTEILTEAIDDYSSDEIRAMISSLRVSSERVYALLETLLAWSKLQQDTMEYQPRKISLDDIIEDTVQLFRPSAEPKQIALRCVVPKATTAYADLNMVHTILRNLTSNAIKFTNAGGTVEISARSNDTWVEILVSDTGIGIHEEDVSKLFRIDVKFTTEGTDGEKGNGLGLNLCKDLIEKNGGKIWVETEVGRGTIFTFTLPRKTVS